jgi:hypothetical protein
MTASDALLTPCGWQVGLTHSAAIVHTFLSSFKPCVSFTEIDLFHALWSETVLQFRVIYSSKKCLYFIKNKLVFFIVF